MTLEVKKYKNRLRAVFFIKSIVGVILISGLLFSCSKPAKLIDIQGQAQGTFYSIKYISESSTPPLDKLYFDNLFSSVDSSLSIYKPYSLINQFNDNDSILTDDLWLIQMILQSDRIYRESDGEFDPSVVHLVNAWGFGPDSKSYKGKAPVDSLLKITGWDKIELKLMPDGKMLLKKKVKGVKIGFNAIAQGYTSDIIAEKLEQNKIENYLIDTGGELRAKGHNQNGDIWRIGIDRPVALQEERSIVAVFPLENASVATSGSYRKFYEMDGVRYSHAISPKTGRPVNHPVLSVTIITDTCSLADGYATALMVMGIDKGKIFLSKHPELQAYLIFTDSTGEYQHFMTEGLKDHIKALN